MKKELLYEITCTVDNLYFDIEELESLAYVLNVASSNKEMGCREFNGALTILNNRLEQMHHDINFVANRLNDIQANEQQGRPPKGNPAAKQITARQPPQN